MINLDATTKTLEVVLADAITTNQLPVVVSFVDILTSTQGVSTISESDTATNSTTPVTILAAPASGHTRTVKTLTVYNADTVNATVTIQVNNNSTTRILCKRTLASGTTLQYDDATGFTVAFAASVNLTSDVTGTLPVANGGTGATTLTNHGVLLGQGTSAVAATAAGTSGQPLLSGGAGADPSYGTLGVAAGGTGDTTLAAHGVLIGAGTSAIVVSGAGNAGEVLTSNGASADPTFQAAAGGGGGSNSIQDFRLSLTTAVPVTTSDVTGATTIYAVPYKGNKIALYDGSAWNVRTSAQFSLALGTLTSGKPYDVFCYDNSGTPTLEFLVWTNDTTRATALTTQDGVLVKTGATTRRYLGTFYTTSTTATEDSISKRFLWNYYNRAPRNMQRFETNGSWTYATASWRQANNSALNQIEWVTGVEEAPIALTVYGIAANASTNVLIGIGIGIDTAGNTDGSTQGPTFNSLVANIGQASFCPLTKFCGVGRHYATWVEYSGSGTTTFYGSAFHSGLVGSVSA
jgi:hypothetical protein